VYCHQCEQTAKGGACDVKGVCGKDETTAALQDLLLHATQGISMYAHRARKFKASDREIDVFVVEALFTTVTNVNFDPERMTVLLREAAAMRDRAKALYENACKSAGSAPESLDGPATWTPASDLPGLVAQGSDVTLATWSETYGPDAASLRELITYGLTRSSWEGPTTASLPPSTRRSTFSRRTTCRPTICSPGVSRPVSSISGRWRS